MKLVQGWRSQVKSFFFLFGLGFGNPNADKVVGNFVLAEKEKPWKKKETPEGVFLRKA